MQGGVRDGGGQGGAARVDANRAQGYGTEAAQPARRPDDRRLGLALRGIALVALTAAVLLAAVPPAPPLAPAGQPPPAVGCRV